MKPAASLRSQILAAVVTPPIVFGLIAAVTLAIVVRLNLTLGRQAREDRVIARASATARMLVEEEGAPAGPPAAGSGPYRKPEWKIDASFNELAGLVSDDPEQSRVLATARKQKERWAEYAGQVARVGTAAKPGDPRAKELMNGARIFLAAFIKAEIAHRDRLGDEIRAFSGTILPGIVIGGALLIGFVSSGSARRLLRLGSMFEDFQAVSDRQERERLGLISEAIRHYAIFTLDAEGRISGWNQDTERLLGYRPDDVLARSHSYLFEEEDRRREMPQKTLSWAVQEGRAEDIRWITRKDGFRFQARVALVAIRDADGVLRGFTNVIHEVEPGDQ